MRSGTLAFSGTYLPAYLWLATARRYSHSFELYALPPLSVHPKGVRPGHELQRDREDFPLAGSLELPREKVLLLSRKMGLPLPTVLPLVIPGQVGCSSRFQRDGSPPPQY